MLPLQLEGGLEPEWAGKLEAAIVRGLVQGGVEVVRAARVTEATGGVGDCQNQKCFAFVSSSVDSRFLVRTKIKVADRTYEVALEIIDGETGDLAASSSETCQLCGLAEVEELATKQAAAVRQKVDALTLQPAAVAFASNPPGAMILVDGEELGPAPLERELPPGTHTIVVRKQGFVEQTRKIDAVQGVRETISFDLLPERGAEPASVNHKDWRAPTGWALVGAGTAALAAGVVFLVLDDRPYKAKCSGADVDAEGDCRKLYGTKIHGAALTGGGGVLLVSGAAMLIAARVRRGKGRQSKNARLRHALLEGRF